MIALKWSVSMSAVKYINKFGLVSFEAAMLCPQFRRYNYAILYFDEVDFSNDFIEKQWTTVWDLIKRL